MPETVRNTPRAEKAYRPDGYTEADQRADRAFLDVKERIRALPRYDVPVEAVGILNALPTHMKPTTQVVRARDLDALLALVLPPAGGES